MIIHKCDRAKCNVTSEQKKGTIAITPNGWYPITWRPNDGYGTPAIYYEICTDCRTDLRIPNNTESQASVGKRLIELIEEIAKETASEILNEAGAEGE